MTSRIHAPHTTCPSCKEEVYLDELVGGRCPLCGCSLEKSEAEDAEFDEFIGRSDLSWMVFQYFFFKKLDHLGAHPVQIMQLISRYEEQLSAGEKRGGQVPVNIEIPFRLFERILPKKCAVCGVRFIRGGKKYLSGSLRSQAFGVRHVCDGCAGSEEGCEDTDE